MDILKVATVLRPFAIPLHMAWYILKVATVLRPFAIPLHMAWYILKVATVLGEKNKNKNLVRSTYILK
jgi:hypothetical protein